MRALRIKNISVLVIFLIFLSSSSVICANEKQISVLIDGVRLDTGDTKPFIKNGRTFVPFRSIFEAFGADVVWDGASRTVTAADSDNEIRLIIDKSNAMVNGLNKSLDVPALIESSRTYVPLRFVAESLGAKVEWDQSSSQIKIQKMRDSKIKLVKGLGEAVYADNELGKTILTADDDYMRSLSKFDISSKIVTDEEVGIDDFKNHFSRQVMNFTEDEKSTLNRIVEEIRPLINQYDIYMPEEIVFIKTTGKEEANAAYTRSNAIILPKSLLNMGGSTLKDVVKHEIFHVFSRFNREKREKLYKVIGFNRGPFYEYPKELSDFRISNPDAVSNRYYIELDYLGENIKAVPILYASESFGTSKSRSFFSYMKMELSVVEIKDGRCIPIYKNGAPKLLELPKVDAFYKKVGSNTSYIIQPEELLAENFVMMLNKDKVPSPFVIEGMESVLK